MSRPLLLYINLGTPASTAVKDVRRYLREFLSDPLVIDIPALPRWLLVNLLIAPTRAGRSARAYGKIWREDGSPLLVYSRRLVEKLRRRLLDQAEVELAMRYGEPSLRHVLGRVLRRNSPSKIYLLPAYPQYALSSTETAFREAQKILREFNYQGACEVIDHYATFPPFIKAVAERARAGMREQRCDHLLFSFHGLPERQIAKAPAHLNYREQCYETARAVAREMELNHYSVGFQSRLGRGWIQPFSDQLYPELAAQGVRRLAVVCPSFTVDCLETLEEVALRGHETFMAAGGESLTLIPCVNDGDDWVEGLVELFHHGPWRPLDAG